MKSILLLFLYPLFSSLIITIKKIPNFPQNYDQNSKFVILMPGTSEMEPLHYSFFLGFFLRL